MNELTFDVHLVARQKVFKVESVVLRQKNQKQFENKLTKALQNWCISFQSILLLTFISEIQSVRGFFVCQTLPNRKSLLNNGYFIPICPNSIEMREKAMCLNCHEL